MEVTGDFLFRMGFHETCIGRELEATKLYFYSNGCIFEYVDHKMNLDAEEAECKEYLQGCQKTAPFSGEVFEDDGMTGYNIVQDVLEEIRVFRKEVLKIDKH